MSADMSEIEARIAATTGKKEVKICRGVERVVSVVSPMAMSGVFCVMNFFKAGNGLTVDFLSY